jgi:hypothetical protein
MAQTSLAEFYVRRSSVTSSVDAGYKPGLEEPILAKDEMLAAYGASDLESNLLLLPQHGAGGQLTWQVATR